MTGMVFLRRRIFYIDVSNLLDRWFSHRDLYNFIDFVKKSKHRPIDEVVAEWNNKFAKTPSQYVFCKEHNVNA